MISKSLKFFKFNNQGGGGGGLGTDREGGKLMSGLRWARERQGQREVVGKAPEK